MAKPVDMMTREEPARAVIGGQKGTRLHSQRSTDAEHRDEEDEGCESGWRRPVPRISHSAYNDEQHGGSDELEERIRKVAQTGA